MSDDITQYVTYRGYDISIADNPLKQRSIIHIYKGETLRSSLFRSQTPTDAETALETACRYVDMLIEKDARGLTP